MQPFTKTSKMRKGTRRAHHALRAPDTQRCPKCGQSKLPHRMCGNCGYVRKGLALSVDKAGA
jgi:large subunit ribosomal protein L32